MNLNMAADRKSESKTVSVASDGLTQWVHLARLGRGYKTSLGGFVCDWERYQNPQTNQVTMAVATRHLWAGLCVTGTDIKTPRQTRSQSTSCVTAPCLAFSQRRPASIHF